MPQPTQHSLIPFLLLWIVILSIVQVVVIVLFFTAGHHCLSQNSSTVAAERLQIQPNNTPSSPCEPGPLPGQSTMFTYTATQVTKKMKWLKQNQDDFLISEEDGGKVLKIMRDGYFYLNLQVTLSSCAKWGSQHTVSMKRNDEVILHGSINNNTCSTGLLGKVEELSAESTLEVFVILPITEESINETLTHLDIIYMPRF